MRSSSTNNYSRRRRLPINYFLVVVVSLWFLSAMELLVMAQKTTTVAVKVGLILDLDIEASKVAMSCINMALSDFYASNGHYTTRIVIQPRDSKRDVVAAAAAGLDLIKNQQVQAILGPTTSMQADFVSDIGNKAQVPIVSFSATSPLLTSPRHPYFFRATQNDAIQVRAITAMVQAFEWKEVVPIYIDDKYGQGVIPYLTDALQAINVHIPYRSAISLAATDDQILEELYKLVTMQTRVFVVHMSFNLGSHLFTKAKEIGMMGPGYAWIVTDGMTNFLSTLNTSVIDSMQGVLGVKPYVSNTGELDSFLIRWKRKFLLDNQDILNADMNIYGLWAYDATVALAMAIEETGTANLNFQMPSNLFSNSTDLETFGVSRNGPKLIQALSNINFRGLIGNFSFVGGQLQSSALQIVNVNGQVARGIGFWTVENGLSKTLSSPITSTTSTYSTSNSSLALVIWPGDTTSVPRGREFQINGRKLKVGIPLKDEFTEFVELTINPTTNTVMVKGYSIDVFEAAVNALPYALPFEYVPFNTSSTTYDDMVHQVYLGKFDIVVGDITITPNRLLYVDFTLPYTESGVSMIVPVKDNKNKNAWIFLKPLTWDMWVTILCFFVFIGFCVWVLEHRINEDFRGPPAYQVGTSLWFSFSTMAFAHRERVVSNLTRFIIVIWCFVVLIFTQSYTASLTSLLTVQQLLTDVNSLIKNKEFIGYHQGSFVFDLLKGLGFDESRLISYNSTKQCNELFNKRSGNGGIAAAFDEVPYIKLFLSQYCSKYSTIETTFKTAGFGFVVPRGSPLGPDISRAMAEDNKMKEIENMWFGDQASCSYASTFDTSNSLSLNSFWGLFLIVGVASVSAILISVAMFVYRHRSELMPSNSEPSIWKRILNLFKKFDQRDLTSHTFRGTQLVDRSVNDINAIPIMVSAPSLTDYSVHTEFPREERASSSEYGDPNTNGQSPQHQAVLNIELSNPTTPIETTWEPANAKTTQEPIATKARHFGDL